jgi:heptosyltransferase III
MRRLLIRPGAIGDCIAAFPALEHLVADYTEVWIPSSVVPLVPFAQRVRALAATGIDLVGVGDLQMPDKLKTELASFDSIVSWYGANRPDFRASLLSLGVPCDFHPALPPILHCEHAIDFFARQVGAPLGRSPEIRIENRSAPRDSVVIHPFSGSVWKNWPQSRYRELASKLKCKVEWVAGPEEEWPEAARFDNLAELAGWIAGARLYIGNDSGIAHLAAATGIPVLALFGPSPPQIWAPRGPDVTILIADPLETLSFEIVLKTANRLLDSR